MPWNDMLRAWLELARISNLPTVWTNVTAGWLLAGGGWETRLLWLLLSGSLLYTGGMILNDAADVKFDRTHRRARPIPRGIVNVSTAWTVGLGMLIAGAYLAVAVSGAAWACVAALVTCIVFYDLYHKPWQGAVWVMGMCRVLLVLMPASAVTAHSPDDMNGRNVLFLAHALSLGCYIVGLTWVARSEAAQNQVSTRAAWFARALLITPALAASWLASSSAVLTPWLFVPLFLAWIILSIRLMRRGGAEIGRAVGWLLAGIVLVDAMAIAQISWPLACLFAALAPMLRIWQRWIAAT